MQICVRLACLQVLKQRQKRFLDDFFRIGRSHGKAQEVAEEAIAEQVEQMKNPGLDGRGLALPRGLSGGGADCDLRFGKGISHQYVESGSLTFYHRS